MSLTESGTQPKRVFGRSLRNRNMTSVFSSDKDTVENTYRTLEACRVSLDVSC